jgi:hypothetical protein
MVKDIFLGKKEILLKIHSVIWGDNRDAFVR